MADKPIVLGIDIGGTNIRMGLVDKDCEVESFEMLSTGDVFPNGTNPVDRIKCFIGDYVSRNSKHKNIRAVSIGFPSAISRDRRIVIQTPNIGIIPDNFRIIDLLEKEFEVPLFVNKDTNNLLFYDMRELKIEKCDSVCGIYFGTGVGNAVMLNGRMLSGHNGVASELGHLPVIGNKKICMCGNVGCLETVVSGIALKKLRDNYFPNDDMSDIFSKIEECSELVEFITRMAQVVALQENLFDPDCVVLGGGLLMNGFFPFKRFEDEIYKFARKPYPAQNMRIMYSHPTQINGVIGAAIYAFKRLENINYL